MLNPAMPVSYIYDFIDTLCAEITFKSQMHRAVHEFQIFSVADSSELQADIL